MSPALIGSETYEWSVIPDLDKFFRNLYMYVDCVFWARQTTFCQSFHS